MAGETFHFSPNDKFINARDHCSAYITNAIRARFSKSVVFVLAGARFELLCAWFELRGSELLEWSVRE